MLDLLVLLAAFASTFFSVSIKVAQQYNVQRVYYVRAFITSIGYTTMEFMVVGQFASIAINYESISIFNIMQLVALALGSATGGVLVMWLYNRNKES
jgi:hypothetical protein